MAAADPGLTVMSLDANSGKGAAVLHGIEAAQALGFTHVLTMDADGQHRRVSSPPSWRPRCDSRKQ